MNNPTAKFLKAYIRIDGSGRDVPSSLIYRKNKPTVGKWREVNSYECCITPTSTTTTTGYPCPTICALGDIVIGDQTWTGCNLDVTNYQNGDPIPQIQDPVEWAALTTGAWCYYNNDPSNGCTYGKLYNYYAIEDPRGLIPSGYHLPTPTEIVDLYTYLGGASVAGGALKEAGTTNWLTPNTGATNSSGWTGLPGGLRFGGNYLPDPGGFIQLGNYGLFWTDATIISNQRVYTLYSQSTDLYIGGDNPTTGHSIRLIKDPAPCCSLLDITIGTQIWTGCNLDVTNYQNGDLIPEVQDPVAWANLTTGAWCYYENDSNNGCTYGKMYNWYAVNDPRGLAPAGYHIPSETEVLTLQSYLGGNGIAGGKMKEIGTTHWNSPNTGATNETGWTGLPGGARVNALFGGMGITGPFWMANSYSPSPSMAYYMDLYNFNSILDIKIFDKVSGYCVRLISDIPATTTSTTTLAPTGFNTIYTHFEAL
jgi:uncharacterized protein (TIGR02145 family)